MKFKELKVKGAYLIEAEPFTDNRGAFRRNFCTLEFDKYKIASNVSQANISENRHKHTLRGFHYQAHPFGEGKTMTIYNGKIFDIIVDLRKDSETYLKWDSFELEPEMRTSFHVPPGCANAFLTLADNSVIHYYCSQYYNQDAERGIRYNDPFFNFDWPVKSPNEISKKDNEWPDFDPNTIK